MAMSELEAEILGAVQRPSRASAKEVMEEVGGHRLAYMTINTVLDRLQEKGMVKRVNVICRGGANAYTLQCCRRSYASALFRERYIGL
jgi:predicted transcriptional regulator